MPTYNHAQYLSYAIESGLSQTFKDFEIIVVDDGSSVNVKKVLESYRDKIKYLYQDDRGLATVSNYGIKNSNGKYLAFLDDDLFEPRKLEIQLAMLENNSDIGFVYSDYYVFETNNKEETRLSLAVGRDKSRVKQ